MQPRTYLNPPPFTELYYIAPDPLGNQDLKPRSVEELRQPVNRFDLDAAHGGADVSMKVRLDGRFMSGRFDDKAVCLYAKNKAGTVYLVDIQGRVRNGNDEYYMYPDAFAGLYRLIATVFFGHPNVMPKPIAVPPPDTTTRFFQRRKDISKIVKMYYIPFNKNFGYAGHDREFLARLLRPQNRLNMRKLSEQTHLILPFYLQQRLKPNRFYEDLTYLYVELASGAKYLVDGGGTVRHQGEIYALPPRSFLGVVLQSNLGNDEGEGHW